MTLFRLKSAPFVIIEDDANKNIIPLLQELVQEEKCINLFCYEQPSSLWRNVFINSNVKYHDEFNPDMYNMYTSEKCSLIIDSINQMALCMGWNHCLQYLKLLQSNPNVNRLVLILHKDCLPHNSKLQTHLNHLVNVVISYDKTNAHKVWIRLKKGNKIIRSEEILSYDTKTSVLSLSPVIRQEEKEEEPEKPLPANLSTFKIEVGQNEKIQKYNLKLPYMSKIHEGESKVYYEPDAVDDWDEEDPDEDLDI
ncbi:elongator complex protein 5 [Spodoptera litura]|uniref:Elongator complex protein 5 n=1 Tax=Spodoptera litura TaxID=69820 RepID=A0A9J7IY79_SPOLT|nr:elongator complex protein 5 [Spodoptera litura]